MKTIGDWETGKTPEEIAAVRIRRFESGLECPAVFWSTAIDKRMVPIRTLMLAGLGLETVPEAIRSLQNLEGLSLGDNRLQALPHWLGELGDLRALSLSGNQFRTLPMSIGSLQNLDFITLDRNQLESLPLSLFDLSLRALELNE